MSEQTFDPQAFLDRTEKGAIDTSYEPIPEGEYQAQIGMAETDLNVRSGSNANGTWMALDINWYIEDPQLEEQLGRKPIRVRQSVFLDLTESGGLDMSKGKNRQLGILREAVGQNQEGKAWSPRQLQGAVARITVGHRPNKEDPSIVYDEVRRVGALT